jgi:tight adherence protein B
MISNAAIGAGLAAIAAGGVAYALLYPLLSGEARAEKRQKALVGASPDRRAERISAASRRDQVAQSLKDIEVRQQKSGKISLESKLLQAGLGWTKSRFYAVSAATGVVLGLLLLVLSGNQLAGLGGAFVGALGLPQWVLSFLKKRRIKKFTEELPNAIDVIVRGIRAGLPLGDCLRIIASEAQEPLRSEFRAIVEAQAVGLPIGEAIAKLHERIPVPETNFFGIVIVIQQKAGGSLSEALGNLSRVLRERKRMTGKIKAMSMEAKASAVIIAALPFIVAFMTYLSSPAYIELLWTTQVGKLALVASAFWMLAGILMMRKMINFDF